MIGLLVWLWRAIIALAWLFLTEINVDVWQQSARAIKGKAYQRLLIIILELLATMVGIVLLLVPDFISRIITR